MINLEYDVNTAGVRVSFVLRDGPQSSGLLDDAFTGLRRSDGNGKWVIPQTVENLDVVRRMLEVARERE